ncbi:MAG: hypothetical protein ACOYWZ_11820 [Bacillota bacterium]
MTNTKGNTTLKLLGALVLGIVGLWLIYTLLIGAGMGINIGFRGGYGGGHMYMGTGAGFGAIGTISFLLLFLIKVLFVIFIVGLVVGIAVAIKNYVFTEEDIKTIKGTFTGKKTVVNRETCTSCGKELNEEWNICPFCGSETVKINT